MLEIDPKMRPSLENILKNKLFKEKIEDLALEKEIYKINILEE